MLYRGARRQKGPLFRTIKVARSEYSGELRIVTEIVREDTLLWPIYLGTCSVVSLSLPK